MNNRLVSALAAVVLALGAGALDSVGNSVSAQGSASGQLTGDVRENCGGALDNNLQAQLVDAQGAPVPGMRVPVSSDAKFVFNNVPQGVYTVQIIGNDGVQGSSAVRTSTGQFLNTQVTVGSGECGGFWSNKTALILVGAAAAGGTVAIIASQDEASPSR